MEKKQKMPRDEIKQPSEANDNPKQMKANVKSIEMKSFPKLNSKLYEQALRNNQSNKKILSCSGGADDVCWCLNFWKKLNGDDKIIQ